MFRTGLKPFGTVLKTVFESLKAGIYPSKKMDLFRVGLKSVRNCLKTDRIGFNLVKELGLNLVNGNLSFDKTNKFLYSSA